MIRSRLPAIILILASGAPLVHADTYKWVDEKGVVNYSNKPPPAATVKHGMVEERISVIGPDPAIGPAIAAMQARAARRSQYEEAEFLQRQRYMLAAQASYGDPSCSYSSDCGTAYAPAYYPSSYTYPGGYFVAGVGRRFPPTVMHHHRSTSPSGGRGAAHAGRGPSR